MTRARIQLRRPATLPPSAAQGEPILLQTPAARLYFGTGEGSAPQPLTIGQAEVEGLVAALHGKASEAALAGKADLVAGKVPAAQLPALAVVTTHTAATAEAMLALPAVPGDFALRLDLPPDSRAYVLAAAPASEPLNWIRIETPEAPHTLEQIVGLPEALAAMPSGTRASVELSTTQGTAVPSVLHILGLTSSVPARVRLYRTEAALLADAARPVTADPEPSAGCLAEAVLTTGALTASPHPLATVETGGTVWCAADPAAAVTLTYLRVEA